MPFFKIIEGEYSGGVGGGREEPKNISKHIENDEKKYKNSEYLDYAPIYK